MGIWGFSSKYLSGLNLGRLPIEEIMFFVCIPYACVFTYDALTYLMKKDLWGPFQKAISIALISFSSLIGLVHFDKWYTFTTFFALAICLTFLQFVWKVSYLGRFYFAYFILLVPFFIVNGILTGMWIGEPVVWYNDSENLNIRIWTIPVEDIFYGMLLIVLNISVFEKLQASARKVEGRV